MSSQLKKTITVIGGNGFLGRRICQSAVNKGYNVVSLSRSGTAPTLQHSYNNDWLSKVSWQKADIFDPSTYVKQLEQTDILVHTLGILLESNYKQKLNQPTTNVKLCEELQNIVSPNPMAKSISNSYDTMNRASAILTATGLIKANPSKTTKFVYISADRGFPGLPSGYILSKRAAEKELYSMGEVNNNLSVLIARPGFMFDETASGDLRSNFSQGLKVLNRINNNFMGGIFSGIVRPTISTQRVATNIIENVENDANQVLLLDQML